MRNDVYNEVKDQMREKIKINCTELGRRLGCDRRTVQRYKTAKPKRKEAVSTSKLDEYKHIIVDKVENYSATATSIFKFIQLKGYLGKYGLVKDLVRLEKIEGQKKATVRFETMPGEQAQVDWKEKLTLVNKNGVKFTINIFLYLLGSSRWKYIALSVDKKQENVLHHLIKAFKASGGVPKEILFDNMKTIVDRTKTSPAGLKINQKVLQFAKDFNFTVKVCMPYRPQTKGKVEAIAKLMNRLKPFNEEFETLEELDNIIEQLNIDLNNEICQATGKRPTELIKQELNFFSPLPAITISNYYKAADLKAKVSVESMVIFEHNKYSVPPEYLGKSLSITKDSNGNIDIFYENNKVNSHRIKDKPYNYHLRDLMKIYKTDALKHKDDNAIEMQAKKHLEKLDFIYGGL